jgi:glycosyltransferase involved in cell wall biosynthesis
MRILYVLHQFFPEFSSETERVALNICKSAQRAGHYVHVLACIRNADGTDAKPAPNFPEFLHTIYQGIPVMLVPRNRLSVFADFSFESKPPIADKLAMWMDHEHFDVCHVLHSMCMGEALVAMKRCGLPYLLTFTDFFAPCYRINLINIRNTLCYGPDGGEHCIRDCLVVPWTPYSLRSRYQLARDLLAGAGRLVCPSEYVAQIYREAFPGLEFLVISHGIDFRDMTASDTAPRVDRSNIVLGFIGSIIPEKGLDTLLQAFGRVPNANIRLHLYGCFFGDPVYASKIRRLVARDCRIELLGQVTHAKIFQVIRSLDVLCLPSRVPETFSLVLHKACAAGVPSLVSDLGAPGEFVGKGGFGRVIPVDDIDAWADAIIDVAADSSVLRNWRANLPLPLRVEEEGFFYDSLYRELRQPV